MSFETRNPSTGELVERFATHTPAQINERLTRSRAAFAQWRMTAVSERAKVLRQVAKLMREEKEALARLMAIEMGKPLRDGRGEVEKCAGCCEYFAEAAELMLKPEPAPSDASKSYVRFDPIGVVL